MLGSEEICFGRSRLFASQRVAVVGVVRDGLILGRSPQVIGQGFRVHSLHLVIDEILQVVGIAAFEKRRPAEMRAQK